MITVANMHIHWVCERRWLRLSIADIDLPELLNQDALYQFRLGSWALADLTLDHGLRRAESPAPLLDVALCGASASHRARGA